MKQQNTNQHTASLLRRGIDRIKKEWASYLCIVNGTYNGYRMYEQENEMALCGCNNTTTGAKPNQARIFDDSFSTF